MFSTAPSLRLTVLECRARALSLITYLTLLTACQTTPQSGIDGSVAWLSDPAYFKQNLASAAERSSWSYTAKVGVSTPNATEQANIVWRYADQGNSVRLFGPLGVGAIKIEFDRFGVVLSDNRGVTHRGESAEQLLTRIVGWQIPIDALTHWLFALPNPDQAFRYQLDEVGQVTVLEQQGWLIEYSSYKDYDGSSALPRKLIATKQLPNDELVTVKLITKSWAW